MAVNGVAKFSSAGVVLEFESKVLGMVPIGVKETRLPIDEILDVKFKKGIFKRGAKIEIRAKSLSSLNELPHSDGKMSLSLHADDFERARDAVDKMQKDMSAHLASLPPAHPPVSSLFDGSEDETKELN